MNVLGGCEAEWPAWGESSQWDIDSDSRTGPERISEGNRGSRAPKAFGATDWKRGSESNPMVEKKHA